MRLTYRTVRVLEALGQHPGQSNRQVAELVDIVDQGQMSKLLARLARAGLLQNTATGAHDRGEPNHWTLSPAGQQLTRTINAHIQTTHYRRAA
ncbi:MAG TPA: helix-turn-helix domain-containing protein [Solirubrobacteraceae bacterium]